MQQLMSEQDFCRKAIIETSEILRELTHMQYVCKSLMLAFRIQGVAIFSTLNSTQLYQ